MKHSPPNRKRPLAAVPRQSQIIMRGAKTRAEGGYTLGGKLKKAKPITLSTLPWHEAWNTK